PALPWRERFQELLEKEFNAASQFLPAKTLRSLRAIRLPEKESATPTLLHNDFSGANILVKDGKIVCSIDWDNSVIEAPELDLVKMKYWTAHNSTGVLAHHPGLYAAFLRGYESFGQEAKAMARLAHLYEILWLCRVYNFEKSKEERGLPTAQGYPGS